MTNFDKERMEWFNKLGVSNEAEVLKGEYHALKLIDAEETWQWIESKLRAEREKTVKILERIRDAYGNEGDIYEGGIEAYRNCV